VAEHENLIPYFHLDERANGNLVDAGDADEVIGRFAHGTGYWSLVEVGGGGGDRTHDLAVMSRSL
jgi:hypothetical protein